ncbi:MAG: transglycosylase domain-containing protein, partial [Psychrobacter alimentarius]
MIKKTATARLIHFLVGLFIACLALAVILALAVPIGFYGMAMYLSPTLPSTQEIKTANLEMPLQIYSRDDKLIGQYGNRLSLPVTFQEIPEDLTHAFLAAEDSSFFQHSGISIKGLGRAVTEVVTDDEGQTGGSTITMQVAKNYFLSPERTLNRKLTELFLARKMEDELSKNEILTLYVNKIYLGEGAYGIRAAAKKYYSKSLDNLTIAEMAMLAGLPKAP